MTAAPELIVLAIPEEVRVMARVRVDQLVLTLDHDYDGRHKITVHRATQAIVDAYLLGRCDEIARDLRKREAVK